MPNFKIIGGGPWKNGQKSVDLTWNDPYMKVGVGESPPAVGFSPVGHSPVG